MTNNETLPVIQSDRDAAVALGLYFYTDAKRTAMQQGEMDEHLFIQAFARHRIAAEAELDRLRHDLSRQIAITTEQANEIEALRALKDTNSPKGGVE